MPVAMELSRIIISEINDQQVIYLKEIDGPRTFPIPLYDPIFYDSGKRNGRTADLKTANWIGFFLEEIVGNGIWGRIIPITGIIDRNAGPAPQGLNPLAIRLIQ